MNTIWEKVIDTPFFRSLKEVVRQGDSLLFEKLWDAPKAIMALFFSRMTKKNILIITGKEKENRLLDCLSFFTENQVLSYPSWGVLPGEEMAPNPDIMGKRLEILYQLQTESACHVVQAPLQAVMQKVCLPSRLTEMFFHWKIGEEITFAALPQRLTEIGYKREAVAADKGQFAIRGGILDIFPVSTFDPYRIDFFGDVIDKIRIYDPVSQKSTDRVDEVMIAPAEERELLKQEKKLSSIFDYFGEKTVVCFDDLLAVEDSYASLLKLPGIKSPFFFSFGELYRQIEQKQRLLFTKEEVERLGDVRKEQGKISFSIFDQEVKIKRQEHSFVSIGDHFWEQCDEKDRLATFLEKSRSADVTFLSTSEAEEKAFKEKIDQTLLPLPAKRSFLHGYLPTGFAFTDTSFVLFPYTELSNQYRVSRQKWRNTYHTPASDFHSLEKGDFVVHFHNGIGKFLGVEKQKSHLGKEEEFFIIQYANQSKLFVPLSQSHLISRYIGSREEPPSINALGTKKWQKARVQAEKAILGYAKDLLNMQALREAKGGFSCREDSDDLLLFEEEFPFVPTEDQLEAVAMIKQDMRLPKAMDRLVCGDVGYGKTEVAMRAAFKAVMDGQKQVAVLVPTTVLAMQHYETFRERMANFPIRIGVASRFVKKKDLVRTLEEVAIGKVDILIGTHRLVSKDVTFCDLGLLIIDEEQRFGVRAKEYLKKVKVGVDCLTLSATPIPRTLYLSLVGARDISVINTPPQDRLPIKTILAEREQELIKHALLREFSRGGQSYFIHNRIESLGRITKELETLVPKATVQAVHAQMSPDTIDQLFHSFKKGEIDILISTTIVENGVDIPNANTILIDRADAFGMADLYQIRGRVGRWNRPAYAYFLVPPNRELSEISRKRLQALVETSGFGGGMKLAMRDLEIRGAGDLLGVKQSGSVSTIGFHFYCKLLKNAIARLKNEVPISFFDTRIEVSVAAAFPPSYIAETSLRLELYHRLGEVISTEEVETLFTEIVDRFGPLPIETTWLYHISRIRIYACHHGFSLLKFTENQLEVEWKDGEKIVSKTLPFPSCTEGKIFEKIALELLSRISSIHGKDRKKK